MEKNCLNCAYCHETYSVRQLKYKKISTKILICKYGLGKLRNIKPCVRWEIKPKDEPETKKKFNLLDWLEKYTNIILYTLCFILSIVFWKMFLT